MLCCRKMCHIIPDLPDTSSNTSTISSDLFNSDSHLRQSKHSIWSKIDSSSLHDRQSWAIQIVRFKQQGRSAMNQVIDVEVTRTDTSHTPVLSPVTPPLGEVTRVRKEKVVSTIAPHTSDPIKTCTFGDTLSKKQSPNKKGLSSDKYVNSCDILNASSSITSTDVPDNVTSTVSGYVTTSHTERLRSSSSSQISTTRPPVRTNREPVTTSREPVTTSREAVIDMRNKRDYDFGSRGPCLEGVTVVSHHSVISSMSSTSSMSHRSMSVSIIKLYNYHL